MTITQGIADYIVRTKYADIPAKILKKAKECILDSIGVALYGSRFEASIIASTVAEESNSSGGKASILGRGMKTPPSLAAFINGVMTHVADFDDGLVVFRGHPSCVLMPAVLATCEISRGSGEDFLTAFVIGGEVGGKLGSSMGGDVTEVGWHGTGIIGAIGAAAAASKVFNLDPNRVVNALGIAASSASGLRVNFGTMTKSYHAGHAAMVGVLAAQLAEKGFDASSVAMEGNEGFAKLFGCRGNLSLLMGNLGTDYALNGIMLKPYPSCGGTHTAVDAILKFRNQVDFRLENIVEIEVCVQPKFLKILFHHNPKTPLEAKFSMEFCISAALVFGQLGIKQFEGESIFNSQVRDLMKKIKMIPIDELKKVSEERGILAPVRLKVKLRGGEEFCETVLEARGGPSNPMSQNEIREKFKECASQILPALSVKRALETIEHLETLKDISDLTSILSY